MAALTVAVALSTVEDPVSACPCRGSSGPGGALTSQLDTFGASFTQSVLFVHGGWSPFGEYADLGSGAMQTQLDYALALAWRAVDTVELGADVAYGRQSTSAVGFSSERTSFGDTSLRARWEAFDEPMPWRGEPWPSVAGVFTVRTPTGSVDPPRQPDEGRVQSGTTGTIGASASSQGLGSWEMGLAVDLSRRITAWWRVNAVGEVAFRLPDDSIGLERRLPPRAFTQASLVHSPSTTMTLGLSTDLGWEADVRFDGQKRSGTTQRLWNVGAFWTLRSEKTGVRTGILIRHAPPVDEISVNAARATSVGVSLGWSG